MAEVSPADTDTVTEEREELMVPHRGGNPIRRVAHFLKPTISIWEELPSFPQPSTPDMSQLRTGQSNAKGKGVISQLEVHFKGWRPPQKKWRTWVEELRPRYQQLWKQAGIYEAILASTYKIKRDKDMVIELSGKWCTETNTFFLPWGEATITLEDVMILGGYSVLGGPISNLINCNEFIRIEEELSEVHRHIKKSYVRHYSWMDHFMGSGKLEHEAFLALWLSRYVFPIKYDTVESKFFAIAINLSRGIRLALAPAVLASIYRDMSVLKNSIVELLKFGVWNVITLWAPFQLVQLWVWERFPALGPEPKAIIDGEPRASMWDNLPRLKTKDFEKALDSAGECFEWRPYTKLLNNSCFGKLSRETGGWVYVDYKIAEDLESVVRCLRNSELVGLECVEQYLPHRVALQFGMDQDIPRPISRLNESTATAFNIYSRPFRSRKVYIPARGFKPDVTCRYFEWWKQSMLAQEVLTKKETEDQKESVVRFQQASWGNPEGNQFFIPPGVPSNFRQLDARNNFGTSGSNNTKPPSRKRMNNNLMTELAVKGGASSSSPVHGSSQRKESSVRSVERNMQGQALMEGQKRALEEMQFASPKRQAIPLNRNPAESSNFGFIMMDGLQPKSHGVENGFVYKI